LPNIEEVLLRKDPQISKVREKAIERRKWTTFFTQEGIKLSNIGEKTAQIPSKKITQYIFIEVR